MTKSHSAKGPSQRQLRINQEIRSILSDVIRRGDFNFEFPSGIDPTITEVSISPDLKNTTIYLTSLDLTHIDKAITIFNRNTAFFKKFIGQELNLKFIPRLTFKRDTSFEYGQKIENILQSIRLSDSIKEKDE